MAEVVLDEVTKVYADGIKAVDSLALDIADGEFMVLVGPSGCGKTTALRMVAGLEEISGGVVRIGERVVNHVPSRDRDIAMVFQSYALYPHLSVYDNIAFGLRVKKMPKQEIERRVRDAAQVLGLEPFLKRKPRALSGGQRQRVAMGRAIVREPSAFLMDEPLSNLDAKLRVQMRAEVSRLQRDLGTTTIYVTHDQVEAMTMGDRVAVMRKGRAAASRRSSDAVRPSSQSLRRGLHRLACHEHDRGDGDAGERRACGGRRQATAQARRRGAGAEPCPARLRGPDHHPGHPARGPRGSVARAGHRRRTAGCGASRSCVRPSAPS